MPLSGASSPQTSWISSSARTERPPLQPLELGAHPDAQERVERRERLVEQEDLRLGDERAGERDALLLAAGELGRKPLGVARHVDEASMSIAWRAARPWRRRASSSEKATLSTALRWGNSA